MRIVRLSAGLLVLALAVPTGARADDDAPAAELTWMSIADWTCSRSPSPR